MKIIPARDVYRSTASLHRVSAARKAGLDSINAEVKQGTRRDAILYSVGANADHGLRRTNADKRRAVMTLLNDDEWSQWSDREIARKAAVSNRFVSNLRSEIVTVNDSQSDEAPPRTYTTKHGATATMRTENIGKRNKPRFVPPRQLHGSINSMVLHMAVIQNAVCPKAIFGTWRLRGLRRRSPVTLRFYGLNRTSMHKTYQICGCPGNQLHFAGSGRSLEEPVHSPGGSEDAMKNVVTVVIGLIGAVGVIAGISYVEKRPDPATTEAIEIVQDTSWNFVDNMTIQDHLNQITGVDGEIAWNAFQTNDRPSDSIWVVEAVITKPETYAATEGVFQFTVNVSSEIVERGYIGIDGESTSLLEMPGIFPLTLSKEEFEEYFSDNE